MYLRNLNIILHTLYTVFCDRVPSQVNHLGHFYLTLELLPIILSSAPDARIVFVSSVVHKFANEFDPNNLQGEQRYRGNDQYANTKLFNVSNLCMHLKVLYFYHKNHDDD